MNDNVKFKVTVLTGPERVVIPGLAFIGAAGILYTVSRGAYKLGEKVGRTKKTLKEYIHSVKEES